MRAKPFILLGAAGSAAMVFCLTCRGEESVPAQRTFPSMSDATNALVTAAEKDDKSAMREIFGPEVTNLLTGDPVLDQKHFQSFVKKVRERCDVVHDGGKIVLNLGHEEWPFPIPLVETNGSWRFDTAAGEEEIINRHIGRDEYYAIGVCRAFVKAEQEYSGEFGSPGRAKYAEKITSSHGKKDGLYWQEKNNTPSPLWPVVAEACEQGYSAHEAKRLEPFHGYVFKILTRQGPDASGGAMNYVHHGEMTDGFAMVAYPVKFGDSGVMTFIVNQDGTVYQRCLGEDTAKIAAAMKEYNPGQEWTKVTEAGLDLMASQPSQSLQ